MAEKLRVMIADDDVNIALALKLIVNANFSCEVVDTAIDGMEAWKKIQAGNYNLVLSDWNMPRMDGNQLLYKVKTEERTSKIPFLMLTVRKDVESVAAAVKAGVSDYVIKPFDKTLLIQKIEKLVGENSGRQVEKEKSAEAPVSGAIDPKSISVKIMELIGKGEVTLPALPQVIFTIEETMKRLDADVHDIAEVMEMDSGISSRLIGVANSVYYRGIKECTMVEEAITRLGMDETRQLAYLISNRSLFALKDSRFEETIKDMHIHATACGAAYQSIAKHLQISDSHNYFALGLFHDIGKLLVLQVLSELTKDMHGIDLTLSMDIMNSLHTKAGYMLLSKWSFPPIYSSVALNHEDISAFDDPEPELVVVNFANLFVRELGFSLRIEKEKDLLGSKSARLMNLNTGILNKVEEEVKEHVGKVNAVL
ncbi:MAG: HDOD domain-containing protein [Dissulfurispiraceae bacterium]